jgi:hypothetical protein
VKNLPHNASFESFDKDAPAKPGTKQLAERGIEISHETVRFWWNRFGPMFAAEIRKRRAAHVRGFIQWRWVRRSLSLAFFCPPLMQASIEGRLPRGFGVKRLMDLPLIWADQWRALGLKAPSRS